MKDVLRGSAPALLLSFLISLGLFGCAEDGEVVVVFPTATATSAPATATRTIIVVPTSTAPPSVTHTAPLPTVTVPPSATRTATAASATSTPAPATATHTALATNTPAATATGSAAPTPTSSPRPTLPTSSTGLYVGAAKRDISPSTPVNLGGYGFGPGRRSTGILAPIHVRAFVVSDGTHTIAFAENETQGTFTAYRRGPWGLTDTRLAVEAATGGAIPAENIVIGSDHSHGGPDTSGVWGGLSNAYMTFIRDQTIAAIVEAWSRLQPAQLLVGSTDASELLHSQFDEPPNNLVDGELRVLVAADPDDRTKVQAMMINYAAHATVMGADNLMVSSDWPGVTAGQIEAAYGIDTAVVMVADVGRTQPSRDGTGTNAEKLDFYASQVSAKVQTAVANAQPLTGNAVDGTELYLLDHYGNEVIEFSFLLNLVSRNNEPPWLIGTDIGTLVSALRIGDVLFTAVPGEGYPDIFFQIQQRVPAQEHFIFGLANDQLGYLIAPEEGYPQVKAASPGNDNAIFNVSPKIGDHVMCTLFKAVRDIDFAMPVDPEKCAPWSMEDNTLPF